MLTKENLSECIVLSFKRHLNLCISYFDMNGSLAHNQIEFHHGSIHDSISCLTVSQELDVTAEAADVTTTQSWCTQLMATSVFAKLATLATASTVMVCLSLCNDKFAGLILYITEFINSSQYLLG